jgi:hypothetical protein
MVWLGIQLAFFVSAGLHLVGALLCWRLGVGGSEKPKAAAAA